MIPRPGPRGLPRLLVNIIPEEMLLEVLQEGLLSLVQDTRLKSITTAINSLPLLVGHRMNSRLLPQLTLQVISTTLAEMQLLSEGLESRRLRPKSTITVCLAIMVQKITPAQRPPLSLLLTSTILVEMQH